MSGFCQGQTLHKAFWSRTGLCLVEGKVLAAGEGMFLVVSDSRQESLPQRDPNGWCADRPEALRNLEQRLGVTLRRTERDALGLKAKIQSTRTMLAQIEQSQAAGA